MSTAVSWSVALLGLEGRLVEIEVAHGGGTPKTVLVGQPDVQLYEARDRVKAGVLSAGIGWADKQLTINLTPAALPKSGTHYDLGIAAAVLAVLGHVPPEALAGTVLMGEVGLDGRVRGVRGVLPGLLAAVEAGMARAIVPMGQAAEARLVEGLDVFGVGSLSQLISVLRGEPVPQPSPPPDSDVEAAPGGEAGAARDLADVVGQPDARWALEVAAAGRHHLLLQGAPGVGKTLLAERLPTLLPDLTPKEAVEVSAVHSLAGVRLDDGWLRRPPYADPHHTSSLASLVGGGARMIRPGSISLAHRGVLFLDEAPEFGPKLLESLRTPLENGWVCIGRAQVQAKFPARFQLVAAANPCPCGMAGVRGRSCSCSPMAVRRYAERLSGPILDRIDIRQWLVPMRKAFLREAYGRSESSASVAARVRTARERQARRLAGTPWTTNGEVSGSYLRRALPPPDGVEMIDEAVVRGRLSNRGVDKVLRVAWTLADLAGVDRVGKDQLLAAMVMRQGDG